MLDNILSTKGRLNKSAYQKITALFVGISLLLPFVVGAILPASSIPSLLGIMALALLIPASIRRLHDLGKSGWWIIGLFIPLVGIFVFLYMLFGNPPELLDEVQ